MSDIADISCFAEPGVKSGTHVLHLLVEGMHCTACAWRIESTLNAEPRVNARINFSTRKLNLLWEGARERGNNLVAKATELGFHFTPFASDALARQNTDEEKFLLRCLAVSGFAAGNIMAFSFALWFSSNETMGIGTRALIHWVTGLLALPAILYAGRPFFYSAWGALKSFHANMDVPISLSVILASAMSVLETLRQGEYVYFDASVMLLFFLLIGRYLDRKARGRARSAAQDLLTMLQGTATIRSGANISAIAQRDLMPGMCLMVAAGERIAADGVVESGISDIDTSLITGETIPKKVTKGDKLFAGMINISAPLELIVSAASEQSLLADIVRVMENAEQGHARYVRLADKAAALYTPIVHILALATFIGWMIMGMAWQPALLIATTVLIITCPCALGLAVPAVQTLASARLFKAGMFLKSGDALERLCAVDTIVFDKTGTLTVGKPMLTNADDIPNATLQFAASLAVASKHPLSRAVCAAWHGEYLPFSVQEQPGMGLSAVYEGKKLCLGRRELCGDAAAPQDAQLELWFADQGLPPVRLLFGDALRRDANEVIRELEQQKFRVLLLSGDREPVARNVAQALGISQWRAGMMPVDKSEYIQTLAKQSAKILMVGDGLNDAPALTTAYVSLSPSSAMDITQNAADIVFQGELLSPVLEALFVARESTKLVKQNFFLSIVYNILAVPLAITGHVTPLIAAAAMSSSSIIVVMNALRLKRMRRVYPSRISRVRTE